MARPSRRARKSPSPAEFGFWVGFIAFLLALGIPAVYVAKHRRDVVPLPPEEERFLNYVRRNWTEETGFSKAFGIGLASGIAAATSGYATRAIRRRGSGRGA